MSCQIFVLPVIKHHAGECSGCRRCEGRCPFKVKISERMQAAAKLFGR